MEYVTTEGKKYFCGIDLHADVMYVCILNKGGAVQYHQELPTDFKVLLASLKPYLGKIAVACESTFNWYWLADGCRKNKIEFYLGHALYMKLIHGGKTKNDKIDAKVIADLLRTGFFPPAYPYPQEMRETRDLLRRRSHYVQMHSEMLRHMKTLLYQQGYMHLPDISSLRGAKLRAVFEGYKLPDDATFSMQVDLDTLEHLTNLNFALEQRINERAKGHDNESLRILRTIRGCGTIISLTILYEIHQIERFPTVQKFSSYSRVVKNERSSHGKKQGSKNNKIGNPYLRWAFGQVAIMVQRFYPSIKTYTAKLTKKYGKGKAYTYLAHKLAVAVYYMLKNKEGFDAKRFVATT